MGDVGPPGPVMVSQGDGVAKHCLLTFQPQVREIIGRKLSPVAAAVVDHVFKTVHGDLAENRGKDRLQFLTDKGPFLVCRVEHVELFVKDQQFGKDRSGLGKNQGGITVKISLIFCQVLMDAMAEFMGHRGDITDIAGIVHQNIGMGIRDSRMGKGSAPLTFQKRSMDPLSLEEQ